MYAAVNALGLHTDNHILMQLGWSPQVSWEKGLRRTIDW